MDEKRRKELKDTLWDHLSMVARAKSYDRVPAWNLLLKRLKAVVAEIREDQEAKT